MAPCKFVSLLNSNNYDSYLSIAILGSVDLVKNVKSQIFQSLKLYEFWFLCKHFDKFIPIIVLLNILFDSIRREFRKLPNPDLTPFYHLTERFKAMNMSRVVILYIFSLLSFFTLSHFLSLFFLCFFIILFLVVKCLGIDGCMKRFRIIYTAYCLFHFVFRLILLFSITQCQQH